MSNRLPQVVFITSMIMAAATTIGADAGWTRIAPEGAGFAIEVTGVPQQNQEPGTYAYFSGRWFLGVKVEPIDPIFKEMIETGNKKAAKSALEAMRDVMLATMKAKGGRSSSGELDGYPYLRFSLEAEECDSTNLLVLTTRQMYIVTAVGPKGGRDDDAKRFIRSFRLTTADTERAEAQRPKALLSLVGNGERQ